MDRSTITVVPLTQGDDDLQYWLRQLPEERIWGIEQMRRMLYGYSDPPPRLQRVLEVVKRSQS